MADRLQATRPNGDTRMFTPAEIERGDLLSWGTANDPDADVKGVVLNKGDQARTPPVPSAERPLVVEGGTLQLDMNSPSVLFDGADDGYVYDVQGRPSWSISARASVRGTARQVIAHADGLTVAFEDLSVRAELAGSGGTEVVAVQKPSMPAAIVAVASQDALRLDVNGEHKETSLPGSFTRSRTGRASVGRAPGGGDSLSGLLTAVEITPTAYSAAQIARQRKKFQVPSIPLKDRSLPLSYEPVTATGDGDYMELGDPAGDDLLLSADTFGDQVITLSSRSGFTGADLKQGTFLGLTYQDGLLNVDP